MTISRNGDLLQIGHNFVDAVSKPAICCGAAKIGDKVFAWQSTVSWETAHHVLRQMARQCGKKLESISDN